MLQWSRANDGAETEVMNEHLRIVEHCFNGAAPMMARKLEGETGNPSATLIGFNGAAPMMARKQAYTSPETAENVASMEPRQ